MSHLLCRLPLDPLRSQAEHISITAQLMQLHEELLPVVLAVIRVDKDLPIRL